jgi:hypothetical protein
VLPMPSLVAHTCSTAPIRSKIRHPPYGYARRWPRSASERGQHDRARANTSLDGQTTLGRRRKAGRSKHSGARAGKAQRESKGFGDSYQAQQGSRPDLDATIVGKHVEVATRVVEYTLQVGVS